MRNLCKTLLAAGAAAVLCVGCAGPEQKFGRGMSNLLEFTRMGEINRSIEKSSLFDSPELGYTTGFVKGVNNSLCRTVVGAFEIVTFPIPNHKFNDYGPILKPDGPRYPDSYKPGLFSDSVLATDYQIGFSGGDIAPMVPGSKFRIFEP